MTETTPILLAAITALTGAIVWLVKRQEKRDAEYRKMMEETTKALIRVNDALMRVEELLKNWRAR